MISDDLLFHRPMRREPHAAFQALGDALQLRAAPGAVEATKRAVQKLEVGPDDQVPGAALGALERALVLEVGGKADVGAGEVMDQPLAGDASRATVGAPFAERQ
jgi:hypothetical protein